MVYLVSAGDDSGVKEACVAQTYEFDGDCPVCGNDMYISRMSCDRCGSALEGTFHLAGVPRAGSGPARGEAVVRFGRLARLDAAQLEFVEAFLRCRGVIKNVEDMLGISYPTVKARLAGVLDAMGFAAEEALPDAERRQARRKILAELSEGRISIEEAHRRLLEDTGSAALSEPDEE
jgi:hypothetical protein